jgi:hypothetical protein
MRRAWLVCFVLLWSGCDGCRGRAPDTVPAATRVPGDLDIVFDGQVRALAELEGRFHDLIDAVMTQDQLQDLQKELVLSTGLNPFSVDSLTESGLDAQSRFAGGVELETEQSLWVLPASSPDKLSETIRTLLERRYGSEGRSTEGEVLVFDRVFGPERVEDAALRTEGRLVMVAFGGGASELLRRPVAATESASRDLPDPAGDDVVRIRFPDPERSGLRLFERLPPSIRDGLSRKKVTASVKAVQRAGIDFRWLERGLRMAAEVSFEDEAKPTVQAVMTPKTEVPPGIQALSIEEAILVLRLAADLDAVFDALLPPNSPGRRQLDAARAAGRLRLDVERDLLPKLSGHLGLAVGGTNLKAVDFKTLVGNPLGVSWFALGLGTTESLFERVESALSEGTGVQLTRRQTREIEVLTVRRQQGERLAHVVEAAQVEGALLFATDVPVMDRIATAAAAPQSVPPFSAELRFDELERSLRTFQGARLPLVFRAVWSKIIDALTLLHRLELRVVEDDGVVELLIDLSLDPVDQEGS